MKPSSTLSCFFWPIYSHFFLLQFNILTIVFVKPFHVQSFGMQCGAVYPECSVRRVQCTQSAVYKQCRLPIVHCINNITFTSQNPSIHPPIHPSYPYTVEPSSSPKQTNTLVYMSTSTSAVSQSCFNHWPSNIPTDRHMLRLP